MILPRWGVKCSVGAMGDVNAALDSIEKLGTHAQKIEEYKKLADMLFKAGALGSL